MNLKNQHGRIFYDKLTYIYLEMPNFKRAESELETRLDQWLYFIKYLEDFQAMPAIFSDEVFSQAFEKAELAKFDQTELDKYESSLKTYRDLKGVIDTAFDEGRTEGKMEGKMEVAKAMKSKGLPASDIAALTGLPENEINKLPD